MADTTLRRIIDGIAHRIPVRITERGGHVKGMTGIALGYRPAYNSVKVGLVDDAGKYNGDWITVPADAVEIIEAPTTETAGANVGPRYVNVTDSDGRLIRIFHPYAGHLTNDALAAAVAIEETGDATNAHHYTVTHAGSDGATSIMARHIVVGDLLPGSISAVVDVDTYRDGVRIERANGAVHWWNASTLVTIIPAGRRPQRQAPQQPATTTPAPAPTDPANTPYTPAQGATPADYGTHVNCTHGKRLQCDHCAACETAEETPHHYNGVQVRNPRTRQVVSRCVDCGLSQGYAVHTI